MKVMVFSVFDRNRGAEIHGASNEKMFFDVINSPNIQLIKALSFDMSKKKFKEINDLGFDDHRDFVHDMLYNNLLAIYYN